jgi:hypothetical protein
MDRVFYLGGLMSCGVGEGRGRSGERIVIPGIEVMNGRADTRVDGVSKCLRGSRGETSGTVDRYGLFAKRRAWHA